jgi:hypothetical protein
MRRVINYLVFGVLLGAYMSGCGKGIFNTEPFVDSHRDNEGNVILEDTPRMWQNFIESVDRRVADEVAGERPEAGKKTWNEYWLWSIQIIPKNRENRQKYVNYIIDKRRQEGLAELVDPQS